MERINWMEFREWVPAKIDIVLLPLGTIEAHGVTANGTDIIAPVAMAKQLPAVLRPVAYLTPLWHGVDLCRHLALGRASFLGSLGHVAYLGLWFGGGCLVAMTTYRRRLVR